MKNVVVEIDKAANPYSGLGQFCLQLGQSVRDKAPKNLHLQFAVKQTTGKPLGEASDYLFLRNVDRYVPVKTGKHTLWHSIHQDSPYVPWRKGKFILTIHDLNFLEKYKNPFRKSWRLHLLQKKIDRADVITTISEYSASLIREHMHIGHKPLHVIYNGCNMPSQEGGTPSFMPEGKFLFTIGVIQPRKNFKALFPLLKQLPGHKLVIAGKNDTKYGQQLTAAAVKAGVDQQVQFCGPVDEHTKWWLYYNCEAFVFPSLSEGFGLPVIEAMSCGKPVLLSKSTCLPEIGAQHAAYWDHFEPGHMLQVYEEYTSNFTSEKAAAAKAHAAGFSWENAAAEYLRIYSEL
jgi:glycosyltransferase involved in cell wall biosynthesis